MQLELRRISNLKKFKQYGFNLKNLSLDMWSLSTFAHPGTRSATFGTAYQSAICSTLKKFSLVEDMGFGTIGVRKHILYFFKFAILHYLY